MSQKGEITLLGCLLILTFSGLVLLCSMELKRSYHLLEKRTTLLLCIKETKGEFHDFMKFMGRTNWAIKNIHRASLIMIFVPGLQGAAVNVRKTRKIIQYAQLTRVVSYLKTLKDLKDKSCPIDPRMVITPFELNMSLLKRDAEGAAILRENKWTYYFLKTPYLISLEVQSTGWEKLKPKISYTVEEKAAKLSSLLSSR